MDFLFCFDLATRFYCEPVRIFELPGWFSGTESACRRRRCRRQQVPSLGQEDPLEEEMATHSSNLAWGIPWTEEPGGLQPMGSERVRHDLVTQKQQMRKKRSGGSGKSVGENAGF